MSVQFKSETITKYHELSDKIKENLVVEDTTIKEKEPHKAYYDNLPEGLTKKVVEEVAKYNSKFVTAAHVAVAEVAADVFKSNPNVESLYAQLGYFGKNDNIDINVHREKVYQNHLAKNEEDKEIHKYLVMQTAITSSSVKGYGLKAVKDAISEEFASMFNK